MRSLLAVSALAALVGAAPSAARAVPLCNLTLDTPVTITTGLTYQKAQVQCTSDGTGGPQTTTAAHTTIVDLATPGLQVLASSPQSPGGQSFVQSLPTSVFPAPQAGGSASVARLAVNANLFTHCCHDVPPPSGDLSLLRGLEMSGGTVNTAPLANLDTSIPQATFASSLLIDATPRGSIWTAQPGDGPPAGTVTAVTGSHLVVDGGQNSAPSCLTFIDNWWVTRCGQGSWLGLNARTAVALKDASTLLVVVVDGTDGTSGVSLYQLADILVQLGAGSAINLDGGGSSTMARQDATNGFTVLSTLTDGKSTSTCTVRAPSPQAPNGTGCERYVGATLYVTAP